MPDKDPKTFTFQSTRGQMLGERIGASIAVEQIKAHCSEAKQVLRSLEVGSEQAETDPKHQSAYARDAAFFEDLWELLNALNADSSDAK